ncbi:MAG: hypothetical protein ACK4SZ_10690 [Allosphingosinicella sp.]|uniref:hypothetical protein n=1 Tax=Allosphingosinicella sp. TaxID=2823234 RepID=UPI00395BA9F9
MADAILRNSVERFSVGIAAQAQQTAQPAHIHPDHSREDAHAPIRDRSDQEEHSDQACGKSSGALRAYKFQLLPLDVDGDRHLGKTVELFHLHRGCSVSSPSLLNFGKKAVTAPWEGALRGYSTGRG